MEKYRRPDQDYIDQYDRLTINILKEIEREEPAHSLGVPDEIAAFPQEVRLHDTGVMRAQEKEHCIRRWMFVDEEKDRMIQRYPIPQNIRCPACNSGMEFTDHLFKQNNSLLLFVFTCPKNHIPRRAIYPNGNEFHFPIRSCIKCGCKINHSTERRNNRLILTDVCRSCGHEEITEFDLNHIPDPPISDEDKKKYCTKFIGQKSFEQTFRELAEIHDLIVKQEKIKEEIKKIEWLTVPQLEERLRKISEGLGFIKLVFEKPQMKRHVTIEFSVQDPSRRKDQESIKVLKKAIEADLNQPTGS